MAVQPIAATHSLKIIIAANMLTTDRGAVKLWVLVDPANDSTSVILSSLQGR
jgi:hypothetical protein